MRAAGKLDCRAIMLLLSNKCLSCLRRDLPPAVRTSSLSLTIAKE